jgi:hypothetical protein
MGIQELAMKPIVLKELAKTLRRALGNREKKTN